MGGTNTTVNETAQPATMEDFFSKFNAEFARVFEQLQKEINAFDPTSSIKLCQDTINTAEEVQTEANALKAENEQLQKSYTRAEEVRQDAVNEVLRLTTELNELKQRNHQLEIDQQEAVNKLTNLRNEHDELAKNYTALLNEKNKLADETSLLIIPNGLAIFNAMTTNIKNAMNAMNWTYDQAVDALRQLIVNDEQK